MPDPLEEGSLLDDRYRVLRRIGAGGMGEVFEAEQVRLGRHVVLKTVRPSRKSAPDAVARLVREARAAASIQHPNVAMVHEILEHPAHGVVMVMEQVEGPTLRRVLREGPARAEQAVGWALQLLAGLHAAHARGVVHRDLKPSNLIVTEAPGIGELIKILDFGLARFTDHERRRTLTQTGDILGTPGFMAPEQIEGQGIDARTDVFAVGVILFRALTGRLPFDGATPSDRLVAMVNEPPTPLRSLRPDMPEDLAAIVHRAIEKDPSRRYASAEEMAAALEAFRTGSTSLSAKVSSAPVTRENVVPSVVPVTGGQPVAQPSSPTRRIGTIVGLSLFGFTVAMGSAVGVLAVLDEEPPPHADTMPSARTSARPSDPRPPTPSTPAPPPMQPTSATPAPTAPRYEVQSVTPVSVGEAPLAQEAEAPAQPAGQRHLQLYQLRTNEYSQEVARRFVNAHRRAFERCLRNKGRREDWLLFAVRFDPRGECYHMTVDPSTPQPHLTGECAVEVFAHDFIDGGEGTIWMRGRYR